MRSPVKNSRWNKWCQEGFAVLKQGEASLGETPGVGETDLGRGDHLGELDVGVV